MPKFEKSSRSNSNSSSNNGCVSGSGRGNGSGGDSDRNSGIVVLALVVIITPFITQNAIVSKKGIRCHRKYSQSECRKAVVYSAVYLPTFPKFSIAWYKIVIQ